MFEQHLAGRRRRHPLRIAVDEVDLHQQLEIGNPTAYGGHSDVVLFRGLRDALLLDGRDEELERDRIRSDAHLSDLSLLFSRVSSNRALVSSALWECVPVFVSILVSLWF